MAFLVQSDKYATAEFAMKLALVVRGDKPQVCINLPVGFPVLVCYSKDVRVEYCVLLISELYEMHRAVPCYEIFVRWSYGWSWAFEPKWGGRREV